MPLQCRSDTTDVHVQFAYLPVCLSSVRSRISETAFLSSPNFLGLLPVATARSLSNDNDKHFRFSGLCQLTVMPGTCQEAVVPCGWEDNHRPGVALAMPHRLQWFIHVRDQGPRKGDEHPAYTVLMGYDSTLYL